MSIWTHVAGVIRIDGFIDKSNIGVIQQHLGKTCDYESSRTEWNDCDVPCGSEGSIHFEIVPYKDSAFIGLCQVIVWGDLRDFDMERWSEIEEWFDRVTNIVDEPFMIRQAVLEIQTENSASKVLQYKDKL